MKELTKEEFCELLGVLPTNALVSNIYDTLIANKCVIVKGTEEVDLSGKALKIEDIAKAAKKVIDSYGLPRMEFQDYTTKNNNNLTGH